MLQLMRPRLTALHADDELRDPKTRLQELLQGQGHALPVYDVEKVSGLPHAQHFDVVCRLVKPELEVRGEGSSRRAAEQQAAEQALKALGPNA